MKKSNIILITLEILLILITSTYTKLNTSIEAIVQKQLMKNEFASINYLLKYQMPEGFVDAVNLYSEVAIMTPDGNSKFLIDTLEIEKMSPEDFFNSQEHLFNYSGEFTVISENTSDLEDRIIRKKVYEITNDFLQFYALVGTIEVKNKPNEFIGVLGTSNLQECEENLDFLLSTTNYTNQTINEKRLFSSNLENVTITIPSNWKRLEKIFPYSFYKQDGNNITYFIASTGDKKEEDAKEAFNSAIELSVNNLTANIIENAKVEKTLNKTITTSILEFEDTHSTRIITLIEFKGSNVFALVTTDIISENGIDYIKPEVDAMINSIKVK